MERVITAQALEDYEIYLRLEEKSKATVQYYVRDVHRFMDWLAGRPATKEEAIAYKEELQREKYKTASINTMIAALNSFFHFEGWEDCHIKSLPVQPKSYCEDDRELSRKDYEQLLDEAAREGKERLLLMMETLASTGIRISELRFITVEAVELGYAEVTNKGKTRPVTLLDELREALGDYAKRLGIESGPIFITRTGRPMDRSDVWRDLHRLAIAAGVNPHKVFPHNFRHLFARLFYELEKDLAKLATILGHSNINTTKLYLITTAQAHKAQLRRMALIVYDKYRKRIGKKITA